MSNPLQVKISRDGKEIGTYEAKEAVRLLVYGTLKETDFYWHEGMTDWAPLSKLQVSEARRQLAERASQQKQEEARKAEQLAQDKAKAKEEEDRAVAEATRIRMEKEKNDRFRCKCCRAVFSQPKDYEGTLVFGLLLIVASPIVLWITYQSAVDSYRPSPGGIGFGSWLASASFFLGVSLFTVAMLRSPCCPSCESINFSKPEIKD